MKRVLLLAFMAAFSLAACTSESEETTDTADTNVVTNPTEERWETLVALEAALLDSGLNAGAAESQNLLLQSASFANDYRDDERAPDALMMTVRACMGLEEWRNAVEYLDRIIKDYPNYDQREHCYYQKAYILDYHIRDQHRAEEAYNNYLREFPESEHTAKVTERLGNVGLSDTALINMFEEKNKQLADSVGEQVWGT